MIPHGAPAQIASAIKILAKPLARGIFKPAFNHKANFGKDVRFLIIS
tara:strand:+ start:116 stop:256 length:141 start_codon:yes stop_codon:yes gene_type:complete